MKINNNFVLPFLMAIIFYFALFIYQTAVLEENFDWAEALWLTLGSFLTYVVVYSVTVSVFYKYDPLELPDLIIKEIQNFYIHLEMFDDKIGVFTYSVRIEEGDNTRFFNIFNPVEDPREMIIKAKLYINILNIIQTKECAKSIVRLNKLIFKLNEMLENPDSVSRFEKPL